jgi:uncharacterized protein (TIGR02757 family)
LESDLKDFLDKQVARFLHPSFIETDPISVPRQFQKKQDIEIIGFWTAILSWGQRKTIIRKSNELVDLMEHSPYEFILNHTEKDRLRFANWKHRTFQFTDTLYFLEFLQTHYKHNNSLEDAFVPAKKLEGSNTRQALESFYTSFFSLENAPQRTRKHVATPVKNASCKRLNMFLRWMVRDNSEGVDFGIWNKIQPSQLVIPLDVHVARISRKLNMLTRKQQDWKAALEITNHLLEMDPLDPVKYDFALFGLGVLEKNQAFK